MNVEYLRDFFKQDRFFQLTEVEIVSATKDSVVIGLHVKPQHLNANGVLHGGMIFTLADAAFGVLSELLHPITVTQSAQINYIAEGRSSYVTATATELVRKGRNCIHQVILRGDDGTVFSTATMNGFIKDVKPQA